MREADVIVFLLSPDFIATSYFFEYEIPYAIELSESKNSKLFFIELQPCGWHRTILSNYQQTIDPMADNKGILTIGEPSNDIKWRHVVDELEARVGKRKPFSHMEK